MEHIQLYRMSLPHHAIHISSVLHFYKGSTCCIDDDEDDTEEMWNEDNPIEDLVPERVDVDSLRQHSPQSCSLVSWIMAFLSFMVSVYQLSDKVVEMFLKFLKILLGILGRTSSLCRDVADRTPGSVYAMRKFNGEVCEPFTRYIVCKKCFQIYLLSQCTSAGSVGKRCSYTAFPYHPFLSMRQPCDTLLLKTVEVASGSKLLYPFKVYCYMVHAWYLHYLAMLTMYRTGLWTLIILLLFSLHTLLEEFFQVWRNLLC